MKTQHPTPPTANHHQVLVAKGTCKIYCCNLLEHFYKTRSEAEQTTTNMNEWMNGQVDGTVSGFLVSRWLAGWWWTAEKLQKLTGAFSFNSNWETINWINPNICTIYCATRCKFTCPPSASDRQPLDRPASAVSHKAILFLIEFKLHRADWVLI